MDKNYINHWIIGVVCLIVYLFGDKLGVPAMAVQYAGTVIPALVGHALAYQPATTDITAGAPNPPNQ